MTGPDRGDLEGLLRRALREHADHVVPAGDGLAKIQDRIARRRRRLAWLRPALATLAAAAAAVAIIVVPTFVHGGGSGGSGNTAASGRHTTPPPAAPPTRPALWPYSSEQKALASTDPRLRRPEVLAVDFVKKIVGTTTNGSQPSQAPLAAGPPQRASAGVTVTVLRADSSRTVTTVRLARIRARPATYVVRAARSGNLSITPPRGAFATIGGTVRQGQGAVRVWAIGATAPEMISKNYVGKTDDLASGLWRVPLERRLAHGVLVAWTTDSSGLVLDFSARLAPG